MGLCVSFFYLWQITVMSDKKFACRTNFKLDQTFCLVKIFLSVIAWEHEWMFCYCILSFIEVCQMVFWCGSLWADHCMSLLSLRAWMNVLLLYLVFHWGMRSGVLMWESMGSSLYVSAFIECMNECFVIVSCLSLRYAKWCSDVGVYGLIIVCLGLHWVHEWMSSLRTS